ncbi:Mur ligase family protein, partial [Candidatus Saccharibacteria bacterium]|nr:Mur ligase family protein [Candidatus Saccharibacteria bacterium]
MKIVLLGYGMENQSAERFLRDLPKGVDSIYGYSREELRQADYEIIPEVDGEIEVEGDLIVRTPSLPPWFVKTKGRVTSATKIFYEVFPRERIIGVTGTKGKGTTCTIIEALMRARGLGAEIVGNIGKPALDYVRDHKLGAFAIYETSSFQAWDATESPERAVLLRVESEHLDKHETLMDYFEAKKNLVRFQEEGDLAVVFGGNKIDVSDISATVVKYPGEFRVRDGWFYKGEQKLVEASELRLEGEHNQENALAALAVTWEIICRPHSQHQKCDFDVATKEPAASATPMTNDVIDVIKKAFNGLKSLPH